MEYGKTEIEAAVRRILAEAPNATTAVAIIVIQREQYLPRGASLLGSPLVVFDGNGRRARFSIACGGDNLMPMEIKVEVAA